MEDGEQCQTSMLINKLVHDTTQVLETPEQNLYGAELSDAMADINAFCRDKHEMVIGLAFTTPFESKQFTLFPYILHVDAMADTNKETFALVTIAGKDSYGKMFVILRAFLPCKKS